VFYEKYLDVAKISIPNRMSFGKIITKYFASRRICTSKKNRKSFLVTGKIDGASVAINKKNQRRPSFAAPDAPCVTGL